MNTDELKEVLAVHQLWLDGEEGGKRAYLSDADLSGANLRRANLTNAYLSGANLSDANLRGADLTYAYLTDANLRGADLTGTDLTYAYLSGANLTNAYLRGTDLTYAHLTVANLTNAHLTYAYLSGAHLSGANLSGAVLPHFQITQEGSLIVWKKVEGHLVKMRVPEDAKRTATPIGRKCRAEFADVVEIIPPAPDGITTRGLTYKAGERAVPDSYDPDIRVECTHGIHFFLIREEAEEYLG